MAARRPGSPASRATASVRAAASRGGTSRPGRPRARRPAGSRGCRWRRRAAPWPQLPWPSGEALPVRRQHVDVACGVDVLDVAAVAQEADAGRFRGGQRRRPDPVRFLGLARSRDDDGHLGAAAAQLPGRLEELAVALLPDQAPDRTHDDGAVVHAQFGPYGALRAARAFGPGAKRSRSMPLPSRWSRSAGTRNAAQSGQVFLVLHQLGVRARGGQALQPVDGDPAGQGVLGGGVETVDGVDHHRHAGRPAPQPSVNPGLGRVGVHDVGAQSA